MLAKAASLLTTLCENKKFLKRWVLELSISFAKETHVT